LRSFDITDGASPYSGLIEAIDGDLYGTTLGGGTGTGGTIFKITPDGTLTTLYNFCSLSECADGEGPQAKLVEAADGNLYGTTSEGGPGYHGTIFKMTPGGTLTTLYTFCAQDGCPDGQYPFGLIQASNGDFFGTTTQGGVNNAGTIFELSQSGVFTTLYEFCVESGCADGQSPSGIIQAANGDFYGTTSAGGTTPCPFSGGCGTFFKLTAGGTLTSLYSFCSQAGCADGANPYAGPTQASNGNFYGTTSHGGANPNSGTVFTITQDGNLDTLYSFCSQNACADGYQASGVVEGTDGSLFGTNEQGGIASFSCPYGCGTIFELTPSGKLTTLYSFCSQNECTDGFYPYPAAGLLQSTSGIFYGNTSAGGGYLYYGSVFSLSLGLKPFVRTQPSHGGVGELIKIWGDVGDATSVTFDGVSAEFKVVSSSLIAAKVPSSATSGTIRVLTPSGTLSSKTPFRVQQ
jgi:uncharacterized repeat protein (TIGR03803 family)